MTAYLARGWAPVPLPPRAKKWPATGYTGAHGLWAGPDEIAYWGAAYPADANIGLRMPPDVIGIDVDAYTGKPGLHTLTALEEELGPLPPTWSSTSRGGEAGPGDSRILFFRVAAGLRWASVAGEGIEILQTRHRYAVVFPSVHPDGRVYHWFEPSGARSSDAPHTGQLAELPATWVAKLALTGAEDTPVSAGAGAGAELLSALGSAEAAQACTDLLSLTHTAAARMQAVGVGGRHDTMTKLVYRLVASAAAGHPGFAAAAGYLSQLWAWATAGEGREREFSDMLSTAAAKVASEHPKPLRADPCSALFTRSMILPTEPLDLGTGVTDRALARAVLEHARGRVRYLQDAASWLTLSAEGVWCGAFDLTSPEQGARTILNRALEDALRGDANAEEGSMEHRRSANYTRCSMSAGSGAVAQMMTAYARDADWPGALRLSQLDADPYVLWSGSQAWDLAASQTRLVRADLDPLTPHLRSTPYTPTLGETPHWDAFLAAALPDPGHREWMLDLLGSSLVGISPKLLVILAGERDTGKSALMVLALDLLGTTSSGYATAADRALLGDESHHASKLMQLAGRRLAWVDEGPRHGRASLERLKALTGGGQMTANAMRANPVTFDPTHTLVLTTNDDPEVADDALRGRVRMVPFRGDVERVRTARQQLGDVRGPTWQREAPAVLGQLILRAAKWIDTPHTTDNPADVAMALEGIAADQDIVRQWATEECVPDGFTSSSTLYAEFRSYAIGQGLMPHRIPTARMFGLALTKLGYTQQRTKAARGWVLRLAKYAGVRM